MHRQIPHDTQGIARGNYPVQTPLANAKSAVPRVFSPEHMSDHCNEDAFSDTFTTILDPRVER